MSGEIDFTDDEIREELARLGYLNVPEDKLSEFKKDLMKLITAERSKNTSINSSAEDEKEDDSYSDYSGVGGKHDGDYIGGNFTNHGSQWLQDGSQSTSGYKEDWRYRGKKGQTSGPSSRAKVEVPGSYSLYEVPPRSQRDDNNCNDEPQTEPDTSTTQRKVFRPNDHPCRNLDESISQNETAGIFEIYERIRNMAMRDCECGKTRPKSADTEPPYRIKGKNRCPSVIKSSRGHPHTRNLVRCKPGDRLKMYTKLWNKQPAIGDDSRVDLRKKMRSKMLQKDEIHLDKKVFVPNTYEVPSCKQRNNLRWQVRTALQNYEMPPHGVYHDV